MRSRPQGRIQCSSEERSFSKDHELASEAGRKGGEHSHGGR
ncbi:MAG: general stress protein [Stellaceae bacterium]